MKTGMFMLVLFAAGLPASVAAQTVFSKPWKVDQAGMRVQMADTFEETMVLIRFEADSLAIRSMNAGKAGEAEVSKRLPYGEIDSAEYSAHGPALPELGVRGSGQQRELTIRCGDEITVLRFHKRYEKRVRRELARHGVHLAKSPYMSRGSFDWPAAI